MKIVLLPLLCLCFVLEADSQCKAPLHKETSYANKQIYEEIGCRLSLFEWIEGKKYAIQYDCSHIDKRRAAAAVDGLDIKCYYRGKEYGYREKIKDDDNKELCLTDCFCSSPGRFTCANLECPSLFGYRPKPPCYSVDIPDQCCPGERCPAPGEEVFKCDAGMGRNVFEGQTFNKGDKICNCTKELGTPEGDAKHCKDEVLNCHIELLYLHYIQDFRCAPVFYNDINGCLHEFRCFNETEDQVVPLPGPTSPPTTHDPLLADADCPPLTCKYGSLRVPVGSSLNPWASKPRVTCTCHVPPLVTCTEQPVKASSVVLNVIES